MQDGARTTSTATPLTVAHDESATTTKQPSSRPVSPSVSPTATARHSPQPPPPPPLSRHASPRASPVFLPVRPSPRLAGSTVPAAHRLPSLLVLPPAAVVDGVPEPTSSELFVSATSTAAGTTVAITHPHIHTQHAFNAALLRLDREIPQLPHMAIDEGDLFGSAVDIALALFPAWAGAREELDVSQCTDGITNKLVKIRNPHDRTVLLRCYGHGTDAIIDRTNELVSLMVLADAGFAPPLYGRFANGFCYGFVEGHVLSPDELGDPCIAPLVARHLARWHRSIRMPSRHDPRTPAVWRTMHAWLAQVPNQYAKAAVQDKFVQHADMLALDVMRRELADLERMIAAETASPIVFCHNDLLAPNIVVQRRNGKDADTPSAAATTPTTLPYDTATFIDYEYGAYSYRGFDIGNHFNEFAGFDCEYDKYPGETEQRAWLSVYLGEWLQRAPTDAEITSLYAEVARFSLVSHFYWVIWALVQAAVSDIDFDYMAYAVLRLSEYHRRKAIVARIPGK